MATTINMASHSPYTLIAGRGLAARAGGWLDVLLGSHLPASFASFEQFIITKAWPIGTATAAQEAEDRECGGRCKSKKFLHRFA